MELTDKIKQKIKKHSLKNIKEESCGLVLSNGSVIECKNRASDGDVHFIIAAGDIKKAQKRGEIVAVYHSHIPGDFDNDKLSDEDLVISEYFNIKTILYSITEDKFYEYTPTGKPMEYTGRPYIRNVLDEFVLIKDYFKKELNIEITNFSNRNPEYFLKDNGFAEVNDAKKHDVLIIKFNNDITKKQMTLYLGDDQLIIHPEFDLSKKTSYNYGLQKWTEKIFRHSKM